MWVPALDGRHPNGGRVEVQLHGSTVTSFKTSKGMKNTFVTADFFVCAGRTKFTPTHVCIIVVPMRGSLPDTRHCWFVGLCRQDCPFFCRVLVLWQIDRPVLWECILLWFAGSDAF